MKIPRSISRCGLWALGIQSLAWPVTDCRAAEKIVLWGAGVVPAWSNAVALAAGENFSLALLDKGTVAASGWDYTRRASDPPADLTNVTAIAAGQDHGLALRADGTVAIWSEYCCPDTSQPANLSNVVAIAAGGLHSLALRADGTVVDWGSIAYIDGTNVPAAAPAELTNIIAIAAGGHHSLALGADGIVVGWGENFAEGRFAGQATPPMGLTGVVAIAAGWDHSLALRADGTVVAWGDNYYGQTNVPAGLTNVIAIAAGSQQNVALKADGTVTGWGAWPLNDSPTYLSNVVAIAAGYGYNLAILSHWAPTVSIQPSWQQLFEGDDLRLQAAADGSDALSYQWRLNGVDVPGATDTVLVLPSVRLADAGTYLVVVSNFLGSATNSTLLEVLPLRPPAISSQSVSQLLRSNTNLVLQVSANGPGPLSYQWYFQGAAIDGATSTELVISNTTPANAGVYTVVVSNSTGSITSAPIQLRLPFEQDFTAASGPPIWDYVYLSALAPSLPAASTNSYSSGPYWDSMLGWVRDDTDASCGAGYLSIDAKTKMVTGARECKYTTWHLNYIFGRWVVLSERSGESTDTLFNFPFPASLQSYWTLSLELAPNGNERLGRATIILSTGRTIDFQVTGTTFPATQISELLLQNDESKLIIRVFGPDMVVGSLHGSVAGQEVDFAVTSPLTLTINGGGSVQPLTNGQLLVIGNDYTMAATPARYNLFSNWMVGDQVITNSVLTFSMSSNLAVTATFVTNYRPVLPSAKGAYNGLFFESNAVQPPSSGFFALTLSTSGSFSGKILMESGSYSFSGKFDLSSQAQLQIRRGSKSPIIFVLELDSQTREIRGTVSDGIWTADLTADHAFSSADNPLTNYVGVYTMVIPGNDRPGPNFIGDGYATVQIDFNGAIHMSGELCDGTHISQSVRISQNGQWPLYVPLYGRKGSLVSWITFSNMPPSSLGGELVWFKPALPASKYFPTGLTNQTSAIGSSFFVSTPFRGFGQVNFTNSIVTLAGGNLPVAITNVLTADGSPSGPNQMTLKWNNINGLVRGSFLHPLTGRSTPLHGVFLQNQGTARGYFLGTNQPGSFMLLSPPVAP